MKFIKLRNYLQFTLILVSLVLMWGCGSGGGAGTNDTTNKGASVSIIPLGNREYIIQANNIDGVAGIQLTMSYDSSVMTSPSVIQGGFTSGALMVSNTDVPGTIKIAIITTKAFSGSGQIATVIFATQPVATSITITSLKMVDIKGASVP